MALGLVRGFSLSIYTDDTRLSQSFCPKPSGNPESQVSNSKDMEKWRNHSPVVILSQKIRSRGTFDPGTAQIMLNDTQRLRPDNVLADSFEGQTLGHSSKSDRSILVHAKIILTTEKTVGYS